MWECGMKRQNAEALPNYPTIPTFFLKKWDKEIEDME